MAPPNTNTLFSMVLALLALCNSHTTLSWWCYLETIMESSKGLLPMHLQRIVTYALLVMFQLITYCCSFFVVVKL